MYSLVVDEHETDGGGKQSPNNSDKLSPRIVGGKGNLLCKEYHLKTFKKIILRTFPLNRRKLFSVAVLANL